MSHPTPVLTATTRDRAYVSHVAATPTHALIVTRALRHPERIARGRALREVTREPCSAIPSAPALSRAFPFMSSAPPFMQPQLQLGPFHHSHSFAPFYLDNRDPLPLFLLLIVLSHSDS